MSDFVKTALAFALAAGFAAPGHADGHLAGATLVCDFTEHCVEDVGCTFAQRVVDVALPDSFPGDAALLPEAGPVEGRAALSGGLLAVQAVGADAAWMLTRSDEGLARLSVASGAPVAVETWRGQCRVAM